MSAEAAISYAALILADSEVELSSDNLLALTKAANVKVDSIWANIYAKALEGKDLKETLFAFGAAGSAAAAAPAGGAAAAADAPAEEEKEEEQEESDDDMGFGLFD